MITIIDLCEIGKTSVGIIEEGPIENKLTVFSHCIGIYNKNILVKFKLIFDHQVLRPSGRKLNQVSLT